MSSALVKLSGALSGEPEVNGFDAHLGEFKKNPRGGNKPDNVRYVTNDAERS